MNCRTCKFCEIHRKINGYNSIRVDTECQLQTEYLKKLNVCPMDIIEQIKIKACAMKLLKPEEEPFEMAINNGDDLLAMVERIKKEVGTYVQIERMWGVSHNAFFNARKNKRFTLNENFLNMLADAGYKLYLKKE